MHTSSNDIQYGNMDTRQPDKEQVGSCTSRGQKEVPGMLNITYWDIKRLGK